MIGGNTLLQFERAETEKNAIGADVPTWSFVGELTGWLDLMGSGNGPQYTTYNAAIAESTHVFLADYDATIAAAARKPCRAVEFVYAGPSSDGHIIQLRKNYYDVLLIDDPMRMHRQLEIYLKHTGGQA